MFWKVKTNALVGFPFDDVHVAPINALCVKGGP